METQIKGLYLSEKRIKVADIFGYASKGIPGIEIVGLGQLGKSIKEKFIFLGRTRGLRPPLKKYVLCVELRETSQEKNRNDITWLELPLLLVFWFLGQHLNMHTLNDCLASGQVSADGLIQLLPLRGNLHRLLLTHPPQGVSSAVKYFCLLDERDLAEEREGFHYLPINGPLGHIPGLSFQNTEFQLPPLPSSECSHNGRKSSGIHLAK